MKNRTFLVILLTVSMIFSCSRSFSSNADTTRIWNTTEETIWTLEEAYFSNLYKANYEQVLILVHDQFLGWPGGLLHPISREESLRFMKMLIPKPTSCRITIEKEGIRVTGTVALTHYTLKVSCPGNAGSSTSKVSHITHTWVQEGDTWKLLGGMSCDN